ncbi:hypothetical protein Nepgr_002844 [Nepenthes gracilis]|uniref:Uncharacterized protein n=1 Tax=Nepenthes gracilis TaxID=150966 RepID=A0AAD3P4C8_NEPGR|nr:hypothetical protein Nepgr_002844 [Nepenthes gracilis]
MRPRAEYHLRRGWCSWEGIFIPRHVFLWRYRPLRKIEVPPRCGQCGAHTYPVMLVFKGTLSYKGGLLAHYCSVQLAGSFTWVDFSFAGLPLAGNPLWWRTMFERLRFSIISVGTWDGTLSRSPRGFSTAKEDFAEKAIQLERKEFRSYAWLESSSPRFLRTRSG